MKYAHSLILSMSAAVAGLLVMQSCISDPQSPGLEYMPDMYRSQAYEAYDTSRIHLGTSSSLLPVAGTIPRFDDETLPYYEPYPFPHTNEGYEAAGASLTNPYPASPEIMKLGEHIFKNFCIHCHGAKGDGNGILVERDKFVGVPSYYSVALKDLSVGKMYHTIYYGKNNMGPHAQLINYKERWAVIHYVEKLRAEGLGVAQPTDSSATAAPVAAVVATNTSSK